MKTELPDPKTVLKSLEGKEMSDIIKTLFVEFTMHKANTENGIHNVTLEAQAIGKKFQEYVDKNDAYKKELDKERADNLATLDYHDKQISEVKEELEVLKIRMQMAEGSLANKELKLDALQSQMIDVQSRSMASNILIHNMEEKDNENRETLINIAADFFIKHLQIPEEKVVEFTFGRVHRMGSKLPKKQPNLMATQLAGVKQKEFHRSIVIQLPSENDRRLVFSHLKNLSKDSGYAVSGQYPPSISEKRGILKQAMRSDLVKDKNPKLVQDKLFVQGSEFTPGFISTHNAPQNYRASSIAWDKLPRIYTTKPITDHGNVFVAYSATVQSKQEAKFILNMIMGMTADNPSTHLVYAYRFNYGNNTSLLEYMNDDGEHGAGRRILDKLRNSDNRGIMVVCARWYGSHIGTRRFAHYLSTTEEAVLRATLRDSYHE